MNAYLVRYADSHVFVGVFVAKNAVDLAYLIDHVTDAPDTEYMSVGPGYVYLGDDAKANIPRRRLPEGAEITAGWDEAIHPDDVDFGADKVDLSWEWDEKSEGRKWKRMTLTGIPILDAMIAKDDVAISEILGQHRG